MNAAADIEPDRLRQWGLRLVRPLSSWWMGRRWDVRERGAHLVPDRGPVIYASNHIGWLDGPLLVSRTPRPAHALIKREAFAGGRGAVLRLCGQVQLDRAGPGVDASRTAACALAAGQSIVVFSEGTRGAGNFASIERGVGWLALVSGAPVVPVVVAGTRKPGEPAGAWPPKGARIDLIYGQTIRFPAHPWPRRREMVDDVTFRIHQHLYRHLERSIREVAISLPGPLPQDDTDE